MTDRQEEAWEPMSTGGRPAADADPADFGGASMGAGETGASGGSGEHGQALVPDEDADAQGSGQSALGDNWPATALMLFATIVLMWTLIRRQGKKSSGRPGGQTDEMAPRERLEAIRGQAANRAAVEGLSADMEELCQRLAAHMDNKAARLEHLLEEADEKIRRMERLNGRSGGQETGRDPHHDAHPDEVPSGHTDGAHRSRGLQDRFSDRHAERSGPDRRAPDVDPMHRRIYELADEGLNPVEIAGRLNQPTGQVELVLALRRR